MEATAKKRARPIGGVNWGGTAGAQAPVPGYRHRDVRRREAFFDGGNSKNTAVSSGKKEQYTMSNESKPMERIVSLAKHRGFIFPGSEIYGGLANTWDYGPLGVELKNNIKRAWWKKFIQ